VRRDYEVGEINHIVATVTIVRFMRQQRMRQRDQRLKASKPGSYNLLE
jgi:hypothetical protein